MATTAIPTTLLSRAPDLSQMSAGGKNKYEQFFEQTDPNNIDRFAKGSNLEELAELASSMRSIIHGSRLNISLDHNVQDQWELNRLSEVKERLTQAIDMKRSYYDNHLFGIITKYVLMLFGQWNNGDTAAIVSAEDFLLTWDSRKPVMKISHPENPSFGKYFQRRDFVTSHRDTSHYFNYNPRRLIEMENGERINFHALRA